jgi:hypothetical protein
MIKMLIRRPHRVVVGWANEQLLPQQSGIVHPQTVFIVISTGVFWYLQGSGRAEANIKKRSGEILRLSIHLLLNCSSDEQFFAGFALRSFQAGGVSGSARFLRYVIGSLRSLDHSGRNDKPYAYLRAR